MPDLAVFLDRDGTLIEEVGYATRPEQIRILGGVARALADLARAGYRLIVVTNQSGIARGYATEDDLERFHEALDEQLHLLGAAVDAYYACPHHPDPGDTPRPDLAVACDCRKPKPGLLLRAAEDFRIDLSSSWMVGDTWRDIAAGQAAGTRTVKLPADPAHDAPRPPQVAPPTAEAASLAEAAQVILGAEVHAGPIPPTAEAPPPAEPPQPAEAVDEAEPRPPVGAAESGAAAERDDADSQEVLAEEAPALGEEPPAADSPVPEPGAPSPPEDIEERPAAAAPPHPAPAAEEEPRPEPPPERPPGAPMPAVSPVRHCARCGRDIDQAEIDDGAAAERDGFLLCPECLTQQPREAAVGPEAGTDELLRSILVELERLRRSQRPSSLTFLRILAYIVQAAALFFGFGLALLGEERALYLQVALLLQLLVLALILFERRS